MERGADSAGFLPSRPSSVMQSRPGSAMGTRLRVTNFEEPECVNPEPEDLRPETAAEEELQAVLEGHISEERMKSVTGTDDLSIVKFLEIRVDSTYSPVGNIGVLLPNLTQLKMNNSFIPSMRELGSSLKRLTVLWLSRSELKDLDGVAALDCVQELFLSFNQISDLSPLGMLEHLETLDLEGNMVDDFNQVEYLALIPTLTTLTLEENPIANAAITKEGNIKGKGSAHQRPVSGARNSSTKSGDFSHRSQQTAKKMRSSSKSSPKSASFNMDPKEQVVQKALCNDDDDDDDDDGADSGSSTGEENNYIYRKKVCCLLPRLKYLDDVPISASDRETKGSSVQSMASGASDAGLRNRKAQESEQRLVSRLQESANSSAECSESASDDVQLVAKALQFSRFADKRENENNRALMKKAEEQAFKLVSGMDVSEGDQVIGARPRSAARRPSGMAAAVGNFSSSRPMSATRNARPTSATGRSSATNGSMSRTSIAIPVTHDEDDDDYSSDLTHGSRDVICGNPIISLRSRRLRQTS